MKIRKASKNDLDQVWKLFEQIIAQKVYYPYNEHTTPAQIKSWINEENIIGVAEIDDKIAGAYIVKPNQPGYGAHIANAAYMVDKAYRNRGLGYALGAHSLQTAKEAGYRAMQYNLVVSTNIGAVHLWQKLGFTIIGTIPEAFHHFEKGYVDAHIMYRKL